MRKHDTPRNRWRRMAGAALVTVIALAVYCCTAAPGLTWAHSGADGGDLIAASMTWGVPHPSGYPTYVLLSRLWATLVPVAPIARRFNLFSAVAAAMSVRLVYLWVHTLLMRVKADDWTRSLAALGGTLIWALGPALWQQAVIAEVYALQALFTALALFITSHLATNDATHDWPWAALGLTLGMGLGAHLTTILMWPALVYILWRRANPQRAMSLVFGLVLGAMVFAYLPLAARRDPLVNWGDASTLAGMWWLLTGRLYQGYFFGLPLTALPGRLAAWATLLREQFTLVGMLIAAGGLAALTDIDRRWLRASLIIAGIYSLQAITYDTADSHVYLITAFMMGAAWIAMGLVWLAQWLADQSLVRQTPDGLRSRAPRLLLVLMICGIAGWLGVSGWHTHDQSQVTEATRWLDATLGQIPQGAILVTSQDRHTFALDYAQWAEGKRPDVVVIDGDLTGYAWYRQSLAARHPDETFMANAQDWLDWLADQHPERALYAASARPEFDGRFNTVPEGQLLRLSPVP